MSSSTATRRLLQGLELGCVLAMVSCAGLEHNDEGVLQPQTVHGPCQVKKFYLAATSAVQTTMAVDNLGQACVFTMLNPDLQIFPTASLVTVKPRHGNATADLTNSGRSPIVSYTPQPGYTGPDSFSVTIEPNDHAVEVSVMVGAETAKTK